MSAPAARGPSFALQAAVAVLSLALFYALAAAIVVVLAGFIYLDVVVARRLDLKLVILAGLGVFAVLKGCFFFRDRFQAPGPRITEAEEPRLFEAIRRVAGRLGTRMPEEVYLVPDVNAFVAEVGGFLGMVGTRRVMGIGVGVLALLSTAELEGVLAHEFGHYLGGETRLGGFLYRTRASIGRVLEHLGGSVLAKPFAWYGNLFLRLTHGLSRRQELAADAHAVAIAGKTAAGAALVRSHVAGRMFERFYREDVEPLSRVKRVPDNFYEGLRRFVATWEEDGRAAKLADALRAEAADPYDTHPPLGERLVHVDAAPGDRAPDGSPPARLLLADPDRLETRLTAGLVDGEGATSFSWDTLSAAHAARVADEAAQLGSAAGHPGAPELETVLADLAGDRAALAERLEPRLWELPADRRPAFVAGLIRRYAFMAVGHALVRDHGYRWSTRPGADLVLVGPDGAARGFADLVNGLDDAATVEAFAGKVRALAAAGTPAAAVRPAAGAA